MIYTTVAHCGNDHAEWISGLGFYKDEFDILGKRLLEIAQKNNSHEVMAMVEHFQNQFVVQRNNIDELAHSINEHAGKAASEAQAHAGKIETGLVTDHDQLKEQFTDFEKVANGLRHEFNEFLTKWM